MKLFNKKIDCIECDGDIYIELKAIKEKFGLILNGTELAYSKTNLNVNDYFVDGDYLNFSKLSVENWEIVKLDDCGIPKNTFRWGEYYYPITIAHYGLELFGKYINSDDIELNKYMGPDSDINVSSNNGKVQICVKGTLGTGYSLILEGRASVKNLEVMPQGDFRMYFEEDEIDTKKSYCVYNGESKIVNEVQYLSLGDYLRLAESIVIKSIKLRGAVDITLPLNNIPDKPKEYWDKAVRIANWFVDEQREDGVWDSKFDHLFYKGRTEVMESGWASGLGQGLAISFLIRMYNESKDKAYLDACEKALSIYSINVEDGGILRLWDAKYSFYEEYPTEPASYVLNGFIFSLLGLYDYSVIGSSLKAKQLFESGLVTLKRMLPLYDLGDRSAYDLTHYTCGEFPNIARWGYHDTHLNLLMAVYRITNDEFYFKFYERWKSYVLDGFRCRHN